MTDKQITIDGVDVSGCKYYVKNNGIEAQGCYELTDLCECNKENEFCCNNPNCHYKQYKRKEQECEKLYKWLPIVTRLEEQFKSHEKAKGINCKTYAEQVFTELDQLKEELQEIREEFGIETLYWKDPNERPHRTHRSLKFLKLKQALTEIRQLLEDALDTDKTSAEQSFDNLYEALEKCEVLDE